MGVLLYAPEVQLVVATDTGFYDVSADIVNGNCTIAENQSHQMTCTLLNKGRRYDKIFKPNDRFALYLKRLQKLLIMTGYLDTVPFFSVWPRSITISGSSTLKKLQYHFWDPNVAASVNLFDTQGNNFSGSANSDQGIVTKAAALLTQVGGWSPTEIHFSALPSTWVTKVAALWDTVAPAIGINPSAALGTMPFLNGNGPFTSGITTVSLVNPSATVNGQPMPGAALPANFGTATTYQGAQDIQGLSSWYCQMQWGYQNPNGSVPASISPSQVRGFLKGAKLMVGNPDTNKAIIVNIAGWGPPPGANAVIGLSPDAISALGINVSSTGAVNGTNQVEIAWIISPSTVNVGPYNTNTQNSTTITGPPASVAASQPYLLKQAHLAGITPNNIAPLQYNNTAYFSGTQGFTAPGQSTSAAAADAVAAAMLTKGLPYIWGGGHGGPYKPGSPMLAGYDCSGLCCWSWNQAGVPLIGTSQSLFSSLAVLPGDTTYWLPGDLVFYNDGSGAQPGHVKMYIGNNQTIEAPYTGHPIYVSALDTSSILMGARRVTAANATGATAPGLPAGASTQIGGATVSATGTTTGAGASFDTIWTWLANAQQQPSPLDTALTGYRALMNDTPLLPMVQTIVNASMRSFCSAPNGDFIAWFPDYFNVYNTLGVVQIQDIELQDFTVMWSDLNMVTHQYAAGTFNPNSYGTTLSQTVTDINMITTGGVATIDFPQILQALFNLNPNDPTFSTEGIYTRFGARPNFQGLGTLYGPVAEFWYALYMFQQNWASQFSANVPITFMPELYPGMIMQVPSQKFQCYVQQVTHSWDLTDSGAGFTTQATITAPSAMNNAGLYGFAKGSTAP